MTTENDHPTPEGEVRTYARDLFGAPRIPEPDETPEQAFLRDLFHKAN